MQAIFAEYKGNIEKRIKRLNEAHRARRIGEMSSMRDRMFEILDEKIDQQLLEKSSTLIEEISVQTKRSIPECLYRSTIVRKHYNVRQDGVDYGDEGYQVDVLLQEIVFLIRPVHNDTVYDLIPLKGAADKESAIIAAERFCDELASGTLSREILINIIKNDKKTGEYLWYSANTSNYGDRTTSDVPDSIKHDIGFGNRTLVKRRLQLSGYPLDDDDPEMNE